MVKHEENLNIIKDLWRKLDAYNNWYSSEPDLRRVLNIVDMNHNKILNLKKELVKIRTENSRLAIQLEDAQRWSSALEAAGVDSWSGYEYACEMYGE